jgi:NADH-quinone oxidoreductase subunit H
MEVFYSIIRTIIFYITIITIDAYLSLFERKLIGRIELRRDASYCDKFGLLQPLVDESKLFFKYNYLYNHSAYSILE